ncbi:transcriptional regulator [Desulfatibacillum alkenivorans]|nr:transcriptional regulator [Desulfatibacillum alkenivorans]
MDRLELEQKDLIPYIGSRAKVSEVLSGKMRPTLRMMRALHKNLGIPAEVLLQDPDAVFPHDRIGLDWQKFPLREMAKQGWIEGRGKTLADHAEEIMRSFIGRAGGMSAIPEPVFRATDSPRQNARRDPYSVAAWCLRIMSLAKEAPLQNEYKPGSIDLDFLRHLVKFSSVPSGPKAAVEFLAQYGVQVIFENQLSRMYIDGAAIMTPQKKPVIGMTLRYDRLDNFWFCLFHELAHIGRHLDKGDSIFVDDLSLRLPLNDDADKKEREADEWAEEALLPSSAWREHPVSQTPSTQNVLDMASRMRIHPAIVAGRARYKSNNFRILARQVGQGQVRGLFL